jgi:hypothetical protein
MRVTRTNETATGVVIIITKLARVVSEPRGIKRRRENEGKGKGKGNGTGKEGMGKRGRKGKGKEKNVSFSLLSLSSPCSTPFPSHLFLPRPF